MADTWFRPEQHIKSLCVGTSLRVLGLLPKRGAEHASWLAGYTSTVPGVPSANSYHSTYENMKPVVSKLQELLEYVSSVANLFGEQAPILARDPTDASAVYVTLKLLDIAVVLNFLKMFNSALINDFAMFKRSFQQIRGDILPAEAELIAEQSHTLHFFLANPNSIIEEMKQAIGQVPGFENALGAAIGAGVNTLTNQSIASLLQPCEHSGLMRPLLYALTMQDTSSVNPFVQKTAFMKPFKQLVKNQPNGEIHVYGSLNLSCVVVLRSASHWQPSLEQEWTASDSPSNCVLL